MGYMKQPTKEQFNKLNLDKQLLFLKGVKLLRIAMYDSLKKPFGNIVLSDSDWKAVKEKLNG